ncbi:hypothetical protein [Alteromonas sp. S005]|uniref:hypothetical protein n=1 Tax=Alteromonas sp. S005 TaxID=3117400 RepID=UPI002FE31379
MDRLPLSPEPDNKHLLLRMAASDTFSLALTVALFGSALSTIRPESILWGLAGLFCLYLFVSDCTEKSEVTVLMKNISSFRAYSILTYITVALSGFMVIFGAPLIFNTIVIIPVVTNALIVRPFVFADLYKKNYTRLFGIVDA